jgi:hypothetical protein
MLRDVFYYSKKPNVHPREKFATSLEDARSQSNTEHFWIINEFCDYRDFDWDFDFEFLPDEDVWAEEHINVWPSQHQKDSGTWLCNTDNISPLIIYRADVTPVKRKNEKNDNWILKDLIDESKFDFSWHPDPTDPPYIYKWGCKFFPTELKHVLEYHTANPVGEKYMNQIVDLIPDWDQWRIPTFLDTTNFDFSWRPNPIEPPMIWQFGTQWQKTNGPRYICPEIPIMKNGEPIGATKYIDAGYIVNHLPNPNAFTILTELPIKEFDYSWHPDATEQPYIYVFGNQWHTAEIMPTIEYRMAGATQIKYVNELVATLDVDMTKWEVPKEIDKETFDFSWIPNPKDPPFIYQFGTQWQKTGGPKYVIDGATEVKYVDNPTAKILHSNKYWEMPEKLKIAEFDTSWHPDATSKPYIYQFGTQWVLTGGPRYVMPKATEVKYVDVDEHHAIAATDMTNWTVPDLIGDFDYSWHPHPDDPPFVYQFGTQWQKTDGPVYTAEGADEMSPIKYIDPRIIKATRLSSRTNWEIPPNIDVSAFDFSWHPDATSPSYIYQFGTLLDKEDGPRYVTPGNREVIVQLERTEIKEEVFPRYFVETTLEDLVAKHPKEIFWALNPELDYSDFDFNWRPVIEQSMYVHAFGSSDSEATQTYLVNSNTWEKGFRELNWVEDKKLDDQTLAKLFKKPDMFFVDKGNSESHSRFDRLKQKFPDLQKTRYLNSWVDTISRCINRASTNLCWILNSELDYTEFNFEYYPNPWQMKMVHVFGTQWSHWGTTFMVNRETFTTDTKYVKIIEHLNNINFVKDRRAFASNVLYETVYIDFGNIDYSKITGTVVKYEDSYLNTFKKLLDKLPEKKEHFIWVISSICDYTGFDFTYICDPFAREQLHVFPSDKQKFGDTFLVNVNKLRELISEMTVLEDYNKVNYNQHQRAKRLPSPIIITEGDTHVSSIDSDFDFPYATFVTADNKDIQVIDTEPMSVWDAESKTIQVTSVGGTRIVVPREIKQHFKRELYDYPYISTNSKLAKSTPMDIVFLSNGETGADENYDHLIKTTQGLPNRVVRVDGVKGRVQAYHAAAEASNTPWMFTVFAKLKVSNKFDWNWQPDRLQIPKHYVFHAKNPVNGLVYGHMAMIAYNKKLTLANQGKGLDFTMDDEHEVLEINSGTANFNTDEWSTWRTSFREALKLRANEDQVSKDRLDIWLTVGMSKFNEYSMEGAQHAVEYYDEVNGDFDKLKLSYDWPWLRAYFDKKYK